MSEVFSIVEKIDESFIKNVRLYLDQRDIILERTQTEKNDTQKKIIENYKQFIAFYHSSDKYKQYSLFSQALLEADLPIGRSLEKYKSYYSHFVNYNEFNELVVNLVAFLLLTEEGSTNVPACYRKYSNLIFSELETITKVDAGVMRIMSEYTNYLLARSNTKG